MRGNARSRCHAAPRQLGGRRFFLSRTCQFRLTPTVPASAGSRALSDSAPPITADSAASAAPPADDPDSPIPGRHMLFLADRDRRPRAARRALGPEALLPLELAWDPAASPRRGLVRAGRGRRRQGRLALRFRLGRRAARQRLRGAPVRDLAGAGWDRGAVGAGAGRVSGGGGPS